MATHRNVSVAIGACLTLMALTACLPSTPGPTATSSSSTITIDSPASGDTVTTPIALSGSAETFEAALTIDALDAHGNSLCVRELMATSGTGTAGTWQATLAVEPPETDSPITLRAYELSAADGSIVNLVERRVTLSATHPAILISTPGCGATVSPGSALSVTGRAFVFEAQFTLELRNSTGDAVLSVPVTAASGTEESDWSTTLHVPAGLPLGQYDLVAFDNSAKDGSVQDEFAVQVILE